MRKTTQMLDEHNYLYLQDDFRVSLGCITWVAKAEAAPPSLDAVSAAACQIQVTFVERSEWAAARQLPGSQTQCSGR